MNAFEHLIRFFPLADNGRIIPLSAITPKSAHPTLPILRGDRLRFLVPKSDIAGHDIQDIEIVLLDDANAIQGDAVGKLRKQDGERYLEFELTVDAVPSAGQQFALMRTVDNPRAGEAGQPDQIELTVFGTVRGEFSTVDSYLTAIQRHLEGYPHAPVSVFRSSNRLTVRAYFANRFQPAGDLSGWRVGIGRLPIGAYNENSPALNVFSLGVVAISATDTYSIHVGQDIEAGNIFQLQGQIYTANAADTAESVLRALGVSGSTLTVPANSAIILNAQPGQYRSENQNRPTIQLLYDSNNGGGMDRYLVVIGADVQEGNIYQVSASGMTTKTVIATDTDTPASIAAQFNTSGGFMLIPQGQNPVSLTDAGSVLVDNTNAPSLYLTDKVVSEAHNVNRYRVYVGSSIQRGNVFTVGSKSVTATASDTPASIAVKLGYTSHPFTIDLPTTEALTAVAKRGMRYAEPDDVSPVRLTRLPFVATPRQLVAEVTIPESVSANKLYSLAIRNTMTETILAQSNLLRVQLIPDDTAVFRWGGSVGVRHVFGFDYDEEGLTQQLRLPIYVGPLRQQTEESQYRTISGTLRRSDIRVNYVRSLQTTMQPEAFHRAFLMALKHPQFMIDGVAYESLSDYQEQEPSQISRHYMALTDLRELNYSQLTPRDSRNTLAAHVTEVSGAEGVHVWLRSYAGLWPVRELLDVAPAEYEIMTQVTGENFRLLVYVNELLAFSALVTAGLLNRVGRVRLAPNDRLQVRFEPLTVTIDSMVDTIAIPLPDPQVDSLELTLRPGDFNDDYNSDFI